MLATNLVSLLLLESRLHFYLLGELILFVELTKKVCHVTKTFLLHADRDPIKVVSLVIAFLVSEFA